MASASKDETVLIWNLDKIMKNLNNSKNIDHQDFIHTIIDDHEHVIDCLQFAPDTACKVIMKANYSKSVMDVDVTAESGVNMNNSTGDQTNAVDDTTMIEEQKRMDDTLIS